MEFPDASTRVAINVLRQMLRNEGHKSSVTVADRTINMTIEDKPFDFLSSSPFIYDWTACTAEWRIMMRIYGTAGRTEHTFLHVAEGDMAQLQRDAVLFRLASEAA